MDRAGRDIVYPPIYEDFNRWGDRVYRVVLSNNQTENIELGHPLPREESHRRVQEILRHGLREGRYLTRDFYPEDANDMMQPPRSLVYAAVVGHAQALLEEEQEAYGHQQRCSGSGPALGEVAAALPEITSVKEGECSVCLQEFEAGSRLRMMPCAHAFHEHCIFNWLQVGLVGHVCPLCRYSLCPTTS